MKKDINDSDSSYNEYINGSKFRFLKVKELMKAHIIVTHIKTSEEMATIRSFIKRHTGNNNISLIDITHRIEPLFYTRHRGQQYNGQKNTYAHQGIIKEMCTPNEYGIPDMLFKYDEFYNHYIKDKDTDINE